MFKVLIVEDEMLVRLGIKYSIDWAKFDMCVIADVGNGQAAWEVYKQDKPDLILTDIKMPVMDGIQLIEKVRQEDKETRFIILTCLEDFKSARKAISLGVSDYIIKLTMSQEEMESVLEKVKNELISANSQRAVTYESINSLNISRDNIVSDYLLYGIYSESKFAQLVKEMKLHINPEHIVVSVMEVDHYYMLQNKYNDGQGKLIRFAILNAVNELLDSYQRGTICHEKDNRFILILCFSDISDELEIKEKLLEILEHVRRIMKTYFDCSVTFGASMLDNGYSAVKLLYTQAVEAVSYKYFMGMGINIFYEEISPENIKKDSLAILNELLNVKGLPAIKSVIPSDVAGMFSDSVRLSKDEVIGKFLAWGHKALLLSDFNVNDLSGTIVNFAQHISNCETLKEAVAVFEEYLKEISGIKTSKKCYSKEVVLAIKYIQEHFHEAVSLQQIAEKVGLNPNYLSGLFKREFGSGLIEYITQFRIEKAKEMLLHTNMKSYEIAEKVGFSDESYFSRTFKKITGIRPVEFKKQWL